jgi:hypothetical protein
LNTFGVAVTLIEREERILPRLDREISTRYRGLLTKGGVKILTDAKVVAADLSEKENPITLHLLQKGKEEELEFQKVLVVGDRCGNTGGLNLEQTSITLKDGFISVDARMKTSSPGIFAAGDVVGNGFSAHKAFLQADIAIKNMLGKESKIDDRLIPTCLYSYPEAASVGLTEEEAKAKYGEILSKVWRNPRVEIIEKKQTCAWTRRGVICGSDLRVFKGSIPYANYPCRPGHEILGRVVEAGIRSRHQIGTEVVSFPNTYCGRCEFCLQGKTNICKNKKAFVKANPEMSIPWARLVRMACYTTPGMVIIGRGQSSRGITTYHMADLPQGWGTSERITVSQPRLKKLRLI